MCALALTMLVRCRNGRMQLAWTPGCCYGDRLTAAILPSLHELQAQQREAEPGSLPKPLDPADIKLISVPAHEKYYDDDECP